MTTTDVDELDNQMVAGHQTVADAYLVAPQYHIDEQWLVDIDMEGDKLLTL